jgi:hypothetical protein
MEAMPSRMIMMPDILLMRAMTFNDITKNCDKPLIITNASDSEFKTQENHKYLLMMFKILVHHVPEDYEKMAKCPVLNWYRVFS